MVRASRRTGISGTNEPRSDGHCGAFCFYAHTNQANHAAGGGVRLSGDMPQKSLTAILPLAFSTAPVAAAVSAPDPTAMLLMWYAIIGVMGLLSAAGTVIAWMEFSDKRKDRRQQENERTQAGALGGFVTHAIMLKELKHVYDKMAEEDKRQADVIEGDLAEIKTTLKNLTAAVQSINSRHEHLEGRLDPLPGLGRPRPRP